MKKILTLALIFLSLITFGQISYYVSNTGNDGDLGTSEGEAWQTISKLNSVTFNAGDNIYFEKGGVWREMFTIPSDGTVGNHINISNYGTGDNPIIYGSDPQSTWENLSGNIWYSITTLDDPYLSTGFFFGVGYEAELFFTYTDSIKWSNERGVWDAGKSTLAEEYDWTWNSDTVFVYAATDPDSRYLTVEVPQRSSAIYVNNHEYITIDGIDMKFAASRTIFTEPSQQNTTGLTIKNCTISHVGTKYIRIGYHLAVCRNDLIIQNCDVSDGGRRNVSIHINGANNITISNILIENSSFHHGHYSTGPGIANDGFETGCVFDSVVIRNNHVYEDITTLQSEGAQQTLGCWTRAVGTGNGLWNLWIYNNLIEHSSTASGMYIGGCDTVKVFNNTFNDVHPGFTGSLNQIKILENTTQIEVKNNIIYNTAADNTQAISMVISGSGYDQHPSEIDMDYNQFYQANENAAMVYLVDSAELYKEASWGALNAKYGWEANDFSLVDPLFDEDLRLTRYSTGRGVGLNTELLVDYDSVLWDGLYDLGYIKYIIDSTATDIDSANLTEAMSEATINTTNHTVSFITTKGESVTALAPTFVLSEGATILPVSGSTQDFTSAVNYTVTALNSTNSQIWSVSATEDPNTYDTTLTGKILLNLTTTPYSQGNWNNATNVASGSTVSLIDTTGTSSGTAYFTGTWDGQSDDGGATGIYSPDSAGQSYFFLNNRTNTISIGSFLADLVNLNFVTNRNAASPRVINLSVNGGSEIAIDGGTSGTFLGSIDRILTPLDSIDISCRAETATGVGYLNAIEIELYDIDTIPPPLPPKKSLFKSMGVLLQYNNVLLQY